MKVFLSKRGWVGLASLISAFLAGCDLPLVAGRGGGSETETFGFTLSGFVRDTSGNAVHNLQVTVWPDTLLIDPDWESLPDPVAATSADAQGRFHFDSLPTGHFRVYFSGNGGLTGVQSLTVAGLPRKIVLDTQVLDKGGNLSGTFDTATSSRFDRFVQVYGLPRYARCDALGHWKLDGLPAGKHRLRFLTREPFRNPNFSDTLAMTTGMQQNLAPVFSLRGVKLTPVVDATGLHFPGLGADNPVVIDNELCANGPDLAFILPAVAKGYLNLKGWIVTRDFYSNPPRAFATQMADCQEIKRLGDESGFPTQVDPIFGSSQKMTLPASGRLVDMNPEPSAGASLILALSAQATPQKPLVILAGASLTTLASAYLLDPTLVERTVVAAIFSNGVNGNDSLANFLVAQKFKFVEWGLGFASAPDTNKTWLAQVATHPLGLFARDRLTENSRSFGDLPLPFLLLEPRIFSGAKALIASAPPLQTQNVPTGENGDIWSITRQNTDFDRMQQTLFDSLKHWTPPSRTLASLSGLSFTTSVGALLHLPTTDSITVEFPVGASATWNLQSPAAGSYTLQIQVRSVAASSLALTLDGNPLSSQNLGAGADWTWISLPVTLPAGACQLKMEAGGSSIEFQSLQIQ